VHKNQSIPIQKWDETIVKYQWTVSQKVLVASRLAGTYVIGLKYDALAIG
jgi:hypothetical protein